MYAANACRVLCRVLIVAAIGMPVAVSRADTREGMDDFRSGRFAEALQSWADNAANGDAEAALLVGSLFDTGMGVPQDYGAALLWYRRAADEGNATAMLNVGVMYDAGRGATQDHGGAARWYKRATDAGSGRAAYNLGLMTEAGDGVPRDRGRAVALFETAAARGVTAARTHLAAIGRRYSGPVQTGPEDAALRDFEEAQRDLLSRGTGRAEHAAELIRRAAMAHNALAEYDLGYCYENGIGVPMDKREAHDWYIRAFSDSADTRLKTIAMSGARGL
ncbi:MAG: sel1 repeat family protein, partial [Acetobacteraceae bacterium]|nr:sel1 repeat family protein [Acetobacteraceae bacterium]